LIAHVSADPSLCVWSITDTLSDQYLRTRHIPIGVRPSRSSLTDAARADR